jgi:hypothetical protein
MVDRQGDPLTITPHQLRHTYATSLAHAGMSLQALMALLGHVTPEITLRYATLASPTLRDAYDQAMGKTRRHLTLSPVGRPIVPDKVSWLADEMLKTRVADGYCSRHLAQGACPYANICETCDNYTPATEFTQILSDQLDDVHALQADAQARGWTSRSRTTRHRRRRPRGPPRPNATSLTWTLEPLPWRRRPSKGAAPPRDPPAHRRRGHLSPTVKLSSASSVPCSPNNTTSGPRCAATSAWKSSPSHA